MAESVEIEDFLAHHGIKGMKWGVTRSDAALARSSERKQEVYGARDRKDSNKAAVSKAKGDLKAAKKDANYDWAVGNQAKNGKEFAVGVLLGTTAMRSYARGREGSVPTKRGLEIDAARDREASNTRNILTAKSTLKDLKAQQRNDKRTAQKVTDAKEFAAVFLAGQVGLAKYDEWAR